MIVYNVQKLKCKWYLLNSIEKKCFSIKQIISFGGFKTQNLTIV